MLPVYDWQAVGVSDPAMMVNKTTGDLVWNAKAHQMLGFPPSVSLFYDEGTNSITVKYGFDFVVRVSDVGRYYIGALAALTECGLSFPLANHIIGEPSILLDGGNRLLFSLGE